MEIGSLEQVAAEPQTISCTPDAATEANAKMTAAPPALRPGSKQALVLELLCRDGGATLTIWFPPRTGCRTPRGLR